MNKGVEHMKTGLEKIDYSNKHGIMVGYIDGSQNVSAVETGWKSSYTAMAQILLNKYPTKEDAIKLVDSPILMLLNQTCHGTRKT
jgi:hypothetical protein